MSRRKLLHILGGGQWQVPSVVLAKSLGYRVLVTDPNDEPPAFAYADEREQVDLTDLDGTLQAAREHRIDGIVCDTTDVGVPAMAYVAESMGLPGIGFETAINFTNKFRMRQLTSAAGVPTPPFRLARDRPEFHSAMRELGLPFVVKPVDSQSSRGVHIVRDLERADAAFQDSLRCSRTRQAIVEGFLNGVELTVEGYCVDGEPAIAGISDKDHFAHRPEVATRLTYPADLAPEIRARAVDVNAAAIRALGLRTGVTHAEYMVVGSEVFLVEIAARGAGTRVYSHIVPFLTGVPIPEHYLRHVMGEGMTIHMVSGDRAANLGFFSLPPGTIASVSGVDQARALPGVQEILLEVGEGDVVAPPQDDRSRPGHVMVFGQTRREVLDTTRRVFETVQIDVQ
jgi:biotin carboxylase